MRCHQMFVYKAKIITLSFACMVCTPFITHADDSTTYPIAGVKPHQRPENAPTITQAPTKDGEWYANALHGVAPPYPASLRFLEDQQNWFTPFTRSGMTGPYDIRGWHSE